MANEPAYWNPLTFVDQNGAALDHTPEQLLKQRGHLRHEVAGQLRSIHTLGEVLRLPLSCGAAGLPHG